MSLPYFFKAYIIFALLGCFEQDVTQHYSFKIWISLSR